MKIGAILGYELIFNVYCKSLNKLGHTEKSIKELIKEELKEKICNYILDEKELNSLYQGYLFLQNFNIEKPTDEIKDLILQFLNNSEAILNHFEVLRPLKLEEFLGIKIGNAEIKKNIQLLLDNEKVICTSESYLTDKRKQTKNWINQSMDNYFIIDYLGIEIFITATNKTLYDEIIKVYGGNKHYKERLKTKIKKLNEEEKNLYKNEIEDIEKCILKKNFKAELFILFDTILEKMNIKNIKVSRAKNRNTIPIFDTLMNAIIPKLKK